MHNRDPQKRFLRQKCLHLSRISLIQIKKQVNHKAYLQIAMDSKQACLARVHAPAKTQYPQLVVNSRNHHNEIVRIEVSSSRNNTHRTRRSWQHKNQATSLHQKKQLLSNKVEMVRWQVVAPILPVKIILRVLTSKVHSWRKMRKRPNPQHKKVSLQEMNNPATICYLFSHRSQR